MFKHPEHSYPRTGERDQRTREVERSSLQVADDLHDANVTVGRFWNALHERRDRHSRARLLRLHGFVDHGGIDSRLISPNMHEDLTRLRFRYFRDSLLPAHMIRPR